MCPHDNCWGRHAGHARDGHEQQLSRTIIFCPWPPRKRPLSSKESIYQGRPYLSVPHIKMHSLWCKFWMLESHYSWVNGLIKTTYIFCIIKYISEISSMTRWRLNIYKSLTCLGCSALKIFWLLWKCKASHSEGTGRSRNDVLLLGFMQSDHLSTHPSY